MGNISKANLLDKDIRLLVTKSSRYIKSVGNPKELYILGKSKWHKEFLRSNRGKRKNKAYQAKRVS